ncbi:MAG: hypothetical protein R3D71_05810 [Rickettsiales bacterium]
MRSFKAFLALIFAVLGGIIATLGTLSANGAPQEAAAAAMGIACAAIPYIIFKIGHCLELEKNQKQIIELLSNNK